MDSEDDTIRVGIDNGNRRLVEVIQMAAQLESVAVLKPGLADVFEAHGHALRDR
jgi:hypothetical protein